MFAGNGYGGFKLVRLSLSAKVKQMMLVIIIIIIITLLHYDDAFTQQSRIPV